MTGAESGDRWRVHSVPELAGTWQYTVRFVTGTDVAAANASTTKTGKPAEQGSVASNLDGLSSTLTVSGVCKSSRGFLRHPPGDHYLRWDDGRYWLKGGADSPENFLAYADFDGTVPTHRYQPHAADFNASVAGTYTWADGKGKTILGALTSVTCLLTQT